MITWSDKYLTEGKIFNQNDLEEIIVYSYTIAIYSYTYL